MTNNRTSSKRRLAELPGHGTTADNVRAWLAPALNPPPRWKVEGFERAGRQRRDPATLRLRNAEGGQVAYRFAEQRELATAGSLRAAVYAACDGVCRVPSLGKAELEDIWAALCMLGEVLANQDDRDEAREWVEGHVSIADTVNGITLEPEGRYDALRLLVARPRFSRRAAFELNDPNVDPRRMIRPALVIDNAGPRWIRAAELATYIRHVVGAGPISQSTLDARAAEVGVGRERFEVRRGTYHPELTLYRLPDDVEGPAQ